MAVTMNDRSIPTEEGLTFNKIFAMFEENDRIMEETSREMDMLNQQMGGLRRSLGEMAERLAAQRIEKRVNR